MRVEAAEFDAGVVGCEVPACLGVVLVAIGLPGSDLLDELWFVGDAAVETLGGEDAEFGFRQVEPAAMFGSVVELETFGEPSCFRGGEGFIE